MSLRDALRARLADSNVKISPMLREYLEYMVENDEGPAVNESPIPTKNPQFVAHGPVCEGPSSPVVAGG